MKNQLRTSQTGFTLMELIIVLTIIGILAAFGLPFYQNYTARAQAVEGLQATTSVRTDIAVFIALHNRWPQDTDITDAKLLSGKYFEKGDVKIVGGDAKTVVVPQNPSIIQVTFSSGANKGKNLWLRPQLSSAGNIAQWQCVPATTQPLEESRLPNSCR